MLTIPKNKKTKIAFGSDFHFEFYDHMKMFDRIRSWNFDDGTDFLIIAGDLHVGAKNVVETLKFIYDCHNIPILYVPGNHEYYDSSFEIENTNFVKYGLTSEQYVIMLNGSFIYNDIMFAGCFGNLDGSYQEINSWKHGALNDFHLIADFKDRVKMGINERRCLSDNLRHNKNRKSVVITHTMPSPRCISKQYEGSYLNGCFANDWENVISKHKPEYWICGHTHDVSDVRIDETDVLMNPMGYPHECKQWKWRYIDV